LKSRSIISHHTYLVIRRSYSPKKRSHFKYILVIMSTMQHVSVESLEDLPSRITYLSSFLELTSSDTEALLASKPLVAPLVPAILDAVYSKLLCFDITAQVFVPKNTGFEGDAVSDVHELTLESPQIAFRKDFLKVSLYLITSAFHFDPFLLGMREC